MAYTITPSQHAFFAKNGYLVLRDVLSAAETTALQQWAQEVHDLPRTPETSWMPYEEVNAAGDRVLCRTENYANYHREFNGLLRGSKLLGILGQLSGEEMLLFKEKSESSHPTLLTSLSRHTRLWKAGADITVPAY
jgi:2-aminoethylphosphonate dioxygenase